MRNSVSRLVLILTGYRVALVFLIAAIVFFSRLGSPSIYILDEARNAQAAREMLMHDEWVVPTFNGELRPQKPPLHYYFMQAAFRVASVHAGSARFFSAVMGICTLLLVYFFTKKHVNQDAAFYALCTLAASSHFVLESRLAVPDPYLIFFVAAAILCFYSYTQTSLFMWLLLSAIAVSGAILSKGPVFLAIPGLIIFIWLLVSRKLSVLWSWKILVALLLTMALSVPWYVLVHIQTNGVFTQQFFLEQNLDRFSNEMEGHGGIFWIVPIIVLLGMLPGAAFIGEAIRNRSQIWRHSLAKISIITVVVFITVFSISKTKLPNYAMPCYPFLAILLGFYFSWVKNSMYIGRRYPYLILACLYLVLGAVAYFVIPEEPVLKNMGYVGFLFLIGVATAFWAWRTKQLPRSFAILFVGFSIFNLVILNIGYPAIYSQNPVEKTAHLFSPSEKVYAYKTYNPAYNFILNQPIVVLETQQAVEAVLANDSTAKIISRLSYLDSLVGVQYRIIAMEKDIFEPPTTVIFTR